MLKTTFRSPKSCEILYPKDKGKNSQSTEDKIQKTELTGSKNRQCVE